MRIAVLTGGGDVPGLNVCIKAIVEQAAARGWETLGFRRGWAGPLNVNPDDPDGSREHWMALDPLAVRTIDRTGGTILHTSRSNPARVKPGDLPAFLQGAFAAGKTGTVDATPHVLRVMEALKIDALVAIGGDDTLSYAARLHREGMRVMAIPKTMDNDVFGTDYCIGFSTAMTRSVSLMRAMRTSAGSHERIAVVELFGRNSGESALIAGHLAAVDRVLIAEVEFDVEKLAGLLASDRAANPSRYAMVAVSEGAQPIGGAIMEQGPKDAYGHRKLGGIGEAVGSEITRLTGIAVINQKLGYLMRAGAADTLDLMVAKNFGTMAVQLLDQNRSGLMVAIRDGNYASVPGDTCIQGTRRVDVAEFYDKDAYRPRIAGVEGKPMFLY